MISSFFIVTIIFTSLVSRVYRSLELRQERIELAETVRGSSTRLATKERSIVANRRQAGDERVR